MKRGEKTKKENDRKKERGSQNPSKGDKNQYTVRSQSLTFTAFHRDEWYLLGIAVEGNAPQGGVENI